MGTIRTALSAGAALIALMAIVPASSQAQAPKAPLQVVPPADQAQPSTRTASKKKAARPVAKTAKTASDTAKTTSSGTSPNQNASRTNTRTAAAVPVAAAPPIAQEKDNVMRGGDSVSLVARLPWWRNDRMQPVNYGSAEAKNQVLAAADAWFAANGAEAHVDSNTGESFALASEEEEVLADAGAVGNVESTAAAPVPAPPSPTFLQSLLAILGGAAAAAASARFLFT